jgi:hypothetical protein
MISLSLKMRCLLPLALFFVLVSPAGAFAAEAIHLVQIAQIAGTFDIYLSENALKAVNSKTGLLLYSRAPRWDLVLCNTHGSVFTTMPAKQFSGRVARAIENFDTERFDNLKYTVDGKGNILGLPVTKTHVKVKESQFRLSDDQGRNNRLWTVEYVVFDQYRIPLAVCHAIQRLYGLPVHDGFPVRVGYLDPNGLRTTAVETFKFNRMKFNMTYIVPPSYRRVKDEVDVLANQHDSGLEFFHP